MNPRSASSSHSQDAARYDRQVSEHGCHDHEALFGLMYEFNKPRKTLLDIGIGTGLGYLLFHKAGLQVSGFDSCEEMLEVCASKSFVAQLVQHDLPYVPFQYVLSKPTSPEWRSAPCAVGRTR